jgi:hypothetical protein
MSYLSASQVYQSELVYNITGHTLVQHDGWVLLG